MTAQEIYTMTKGIMYEKPSSTIYDVYVVHNLNKVLVELFDENNMERMFNGKAPLTSIPYISVITDDVPYEDIYVNNIIPLGLATSFFIDDDLAKYNLYNVQYQNNRAKFQRFLTQEEIDAVNSSATI